MIFNDETVKQYTQMVAGIAWGYTQDPVLQQDLMQEGYIGLRKACEQFNPERATFSTYAFMKIRAQMQRYINYKADVVHIPIARKITCVPVEIDGHDFDYDQREAIELEDTLQAMTIRLCPVLRAHYLHRMPISQIAKELGVDSDCVRDKINEALKDMRELLGV